MFSLLCTCDFMEVIIVERESHKEHMRCNEHRLHNARQSRICICASKEKRDKMSSSGEREKEFCCLFLCTTERERESQRDRERKHFSLLTCVSEIVLARKYNALRVRDAAMHFQNPTVTTRQTRHKSPLPSLCLSFSLPWEGRVW